MLFRSEPIIRDRCRTRGFIRDILAEVEVSNHIKGALVMELLDVSGDHPRLSFLRLHVHLAPQVFQRDTGDFLHEDPLESKLVFCVRTMCNDAWDGDRRVFSNVRESRHLARGLVERLHGEGGAEDVGKLGLNPVIIRRDDRIYFVEGTLCEEFHSEVMPNGDLKVTSREGFDDGYNWVRGPARFRRPQAGFPAGCILEVSSRFIVNLDLKKPTITVRTVCMEGGRVGLFRLTGAGCCPITKPRVTLTSLVGPLSDRS